MKPWLVLFAVLFSMTLVFRPLWEPDEGRYTDGAIQMLEGGSWLRPSLNPEQPHFSKPPMVYWSLMPGLRLLGRREGAARLPNFFAWGGIVLLLWQAGRRFLPEARRGWPALVFASSAFPFFAFSFVTPDILLAFWQALAAVAFLCARYDTGRKDSPFWLTIAYSALGLGFLTKGPPVLLPWVAWGLTAWLQRDRAIGRQARWVPGLFMFLLLGLTWYLVVGLEDPRLLAFFLKGEVADRIFSAAHHRNPQWYKPFIIYGPILTFGFLPWIVGAWNSVSRWKWRERLEALKQREPWTVFFAVWLLLGIVVFSMVPSRLPLYVLPLSVPMAWGLARLQPARVLQSRRIGSGVVLWGLLLFAGVAAGSQSKAKAGARGMAQHLQQAGLLPVEEIVFVNTRPYYGLAFYTGAEIERCDLDAPKALPGAPYKRFETILEEITEDQECRLWAVKEDKLEVLRDLLAHRQTILADTGPAYRGFAFIKTAARPPDRGGLP